MLYFSRREGENGQAIVLIALSMIALLAFAGLAIDGGSVYSQRRHAQSAADSAALAYALAISQGLDTEGETRARDILAANGYVDGEASTAIEISAAAASPGTDVTVRVTARVPTAFIHLVYGGPAQYTVEAVARGDQGTAPMAGFALVTLDNCLASHEPDLAINGGGYNGGVNAHAGDIFVNSPETAGDHCAIDPPESAKNWGITVDDGYHITSVGSYDYAGVDNMSSPIHTGANGGVPIGDPLASMPMPTCTVAGTESGGVYQPGYWDADDMEGGTYAPGIYCITGTVKLAGLSAMVANGVVFYFMDGGLDFVGNAGLTITAPTVENCLGAFGDTSASCTYVGMAIISARDNTSVLEVRGNGGNAVTGTIYAPVGRLEGQGGGYDPEDTGIVGQAIVAQAWGMGNGTFDITYDQTKVYEMPPTTQLRQ